MGLETAVVILEKSLDLSKNGQRLLMELLMKERIEQDKIDALLIERSRIEFSDIKTKKSSIEPVGRT